MLKQEPQTNLTAEQQHRAKINEATALLMAKIVKDPAVRQEIYQSVRAITSKHEWRDEAVYFKEILPNKWNVILDKPSKIAEAIYNELGITANANARTLATQTLIDELVENDVEFYFPYHEDYTTPETFAVTYQDEIKEEENDGWKIEGDDEAELAAILVNETLALQEPVLVIGQFNNNRIAPINIYEEVDPYDPNSGSTSGSGTSTNTSSTSTILDPTWIDWAWAYSDEMNEGFLKGGPEYRMVANIATGILGNNATAELSSTLHMNLSRKDVRKERKKRFYQTCDQAWEFLELDKAVHVYEDDRDGILSDIVNVFMPINISIPVIGTITIGVDNEISTKDEDLDKIIYNRVQIYNHYYKNSPYYYNGYDEDGNPWLTHNGVFYSWNRTLN
ncbi:MAG: hypothetical protein R2801_00115 [Chitinophagales bacterium]